MSNLRTEYAKLYKSGRSKIDNLNNLNRDANVISCLEKDCDFATSTYLAMHVRKVHHMSKYQYLAKHNLPMHTKLYSANRSNAINEANRKRQITNKSKKETS